jgi:hypothetical protein
MRASDADRERVVAVLHRAHAEGRITLDEFDERSSAAYAARTLDELAPLTRDLAPSVAGGGAAAAATSPPIVAVFGGARRAGRWRPALRETAVAIFGGVELDLREAELPAEGVWLSAFAVFGGVDVRVPEGVRVELTGFALFGGREVQGDEVPAGPDAVVLRVHGVAVFGGVHVRVDGPRRRR